MLPRQKKEVHFGQDQHEAMVLYKITPLKTMQ